MADRAGTWSEVREAVARGARHPLVRRLARLGFLARGAVYAVIAALALALALGHGLGEATDTRGALAALALTRLGRWLLYLVGVALAGLALWFAAEAIAPPAPAPRGAWGLVLRIGNAFGAVGYGVLALGARAGPPSDAYAQAWTRRALDLPGGRWLVLLAGAVVIGAGVRQAWRGLSRRFLEDVEPRARGRLRGWAGPLGAAGFAVQGAVFVLVGVFFAQAAIRNDPGSANGFDGVLAAIASQRSGSILLAAVALGLFCYAAYSVVEGRFRRLRR